MLTDHLGRTAKGAAAAALVASIVGVAPSGTPRSKIAITLEDAAFAYVVFGGIALAVIALVLLGKYYPGSGAEQLDWKPTRSIETEVELELQDVDQMLAAQNERRRRRGEPELTREQLEQEVAAQLREQRSLSEAYKTERQSKEADERDLAELLELKNARRRQRGEPEITLEQYRAELDAEPPPAGPAGR